MFVSDNHSMKWLTAIEGKRPGKTVAIMAGVHGNEKCGIIAFEKILPNLHVENGLVYFILGNLEAIVKCVRQIDTNLNRMFRPADLLSAKEQESYERKRALEIMPFLDESEALLDIHSSGSVMSTPFIICEPPSFSISDIMDFPIVSYGWDALEPGTTDYYMNRMEKIALCVECGYHEDPSSVDRAIQAIFDFLRATGNLRHQNYDKRNKRTREIIKVEYVYKTKIDFEPVKSFADFEFLESGEKIGRDGSEVVVAPYDGMIIFCRNRKGVGEEAFLFASKK